MALELSKQAYALCGEQDASGLRAFLEAHSGDIDLYLHEGEKKIEEICGTTNTYTVNIMGLAATHESPECLQVLIDFGADVNHQDRERHRTPLICAAFSGRVECMRLLLEKNADVALTYTDGRTALHQAAAFGHPECVLLLIEAKANVNQATEDGFTGIHWACQNGEVECLRLLVENKADVDCKNEVGETGLILAAHYGDSECVKVMMCVKVMIEAKADVDCKDNYDNTALTAAVEDKQFNCLMVLLDHSNGGGGASAATKAHALGTVLKSEEGFSASEQVAAFMLLAHGTDIDAATEDISSKLARSTGSMYANTHVFIERWHGIALNALSVRVEVDRRVGLGLNGLYHEPLECVLWYLGLSMSEDQTVNDSLDDGVQRVLLPNCAHNANHWFQMHQQNKEKNAVKRANLDLKS
jgi:ankyrin repeat protein